MIQVDPLVIKTMLYLAGFVWLAMGMYLSVLQYTASAKIRHAWVYVLFGACLIIMARGDGFSEKPIPVMARMIWISITTYYGLRLGHSEVKANETPTVSEWLVITRDTVKQILGRS